MFPACHRQAHAEEDHPEARVLHPVDEILELLECQSGFRDAGLVDRLALHESTQGGDDLEVLARPHLKEDIRESYTGSLPDIDQHHRPALATPGHVLALGRQGVTGEVQWMAVGGIASPVDDEISSALDLAQRARDFATQLGSDFGWTVSQGGVAIQYASDRFGQSHGIALRLAGDIAEPVDQRQVCLVEEMSCCLHGLVDRGGLPIDQRVGIHVLRGMVLEPRFAETAGALRLDDAIALGLQIYVIAHAAAKRTGGVFYSSKGHCDVLRFLRLTRPLGERCGRPLGGNEGGRGGTRGEEIVRPGPGPQDEASAKRATAKAPPNSPRHIPARIGVDQLPGLHLLHRIEVLRKLSRLGPPGISMRFC